MGKTPGDRPKKKSGNKTSSPGPGYRHIFCRFITLKNGKKLDAHQYGRKAWSFWVKEK